MLLVTSTLCSWAIGHGGGLDKHGCHTNRSTGDYHCHSVQVDTSRSDTSGNNGNRASYDRLLWGEWKDFDNDCQNTRVEELIDHGIKVVLDESQCTILSGLWLDPFSNKTFTDPSDLDIDHIVPLSWAHSHGASDWPRELKQQFSNDPDNLLPVEDSLNQSKGDSSPLDWLPPNAAFHCEYLRRWRIILIRYPDIQFTESEATQYDELVALKCK